VEPVSKLRNEKRLEAKPALGGEARAGGRSPRWVVVRQSVAHASGGDTRRHRVTDLAHFGNGARCDFMWSWLMIGAQWVCQATDAIGIEFSMESKTDHPRGLKFEPRISRRTRMRMETCAVIPVSAKSASSAVSIPLTWYADGRPSVAAPPAPSTSFHQLRSSICNCVRAANLRFVGAKRANPGCFYHEAQIPDLRFVDDFSRNGCASW
jgi:hypothetical protein